MVDGGLVKANRLLESGGVEVQHVFQNGQRNVLCGGNVTVFSEFVRLSDVDDMGILDAPMSATALYM